MTRHPAAPEKRKVGAKPAQARNADTRLVQLSLNIRAVALHQCVMQFVFGKIMFSPVITRSVHLIGKKLHCNFYENRELVSRFSYQ